MPEPQIPTDVFSRSLRAIQDNPASLGASSTVHARDFYGNAETWVIETFRTLDARNNPRVSVFVQFNAADGGRRYVLPPEVMAAIFRHNDHLIKRTRRRAARKAVDTKRERGIDPSASLKRKK
jgi:hypothetical protein